MQLIGSSGFEIPRWIRIFLFFWRTYCPADLWAVAWLGASEIIPFLHPRDRLLFHRDENGVMPGAILWFTVDQHPERDSTHVLWKRPSSSSSSYSSLSSSSSSSSSFCCSYRLGSLEMPVWFVRPVTVFICISLSALSYIVIFVATWFPGLIAWHEVIPVVLFSLFRGTFTCSVIGGHAIWSIVDRFFFFFEDSIFLKLLALWYRIEDRTMSFKRRVEVWSYITPSIYCINSSPIVSSIPSIDPYNYKFLAYFSKQHPLGIFIFQTFDCDSFMIETM